MSKITPISVVNDRYLTALGTRIYVTRFFSYSYECIARDTCFAIECIRRVEFILKVDGTRKILDRILLEN